MLNNQKKSITLTAESVITVTEGDTTRQVSVEGYSCTISSENPEDIRISRYQGRSVPDPGQHACIRRQRYGGSGSAGNSIGKAGNGEYLRRTGLCMILSKL